MRLTKKCNLRDQLYICLILDWSSFNLLFYLFLFSTHLYKDTFKKIFQVTNIEYDEHKGRIAIGRLHAGTLRKGLDVRVRLS